MAMALSWSAERARLCTVTQAHLRWALCKESWPKPTKIKLFRQQAYICGVHKLKKSSSIQFEFQISFLVSFYLHFN